MSVVPKSYVELMFIRFTRAQGALCVDVSCVAVVVVVRVGVGTWRGSCGQVRLGYKSAHGRGILSHARGAQPLANNAKAVRGGTTQAAQQ